MYALDVECFRASIEDVLTALPGLPAAKSQGAYSFFACGVPQL